MVIQAGNKINKRKRILMNLENKVDQGKKTKTILKRSSKISKKHSSGPPIKYLRSLVTIFVIIGYLTVSIISESLDLPFLPPRLTREVQFLNWVYFKPGTYQKFFALGEILRLEPPRKVMLCSTTSISVNMTITTLQGRF